MRKIVPFIAAAAVSVAVLVAGAGAGSAPNTQIHGTVTHKSTQKWHIFSTQSGTARCKLDKKAWFRCGVGYQTFRNLKKGTHTLRAKAINTSGKADPTPAKKTWKVN